MAKVLSVMEEESAISGKRANFGTKKKDVDYAEVSRSPLGLTRER